MSSDNRVDRLNSQLRKNIYEILSQKVKNPHLTEMFSITEVTCDRDLTLAKVYISIFSTDSQKAQKTFDAIKQSAGFVRSKLLKSMRIHAVPQLVFEIDNRLQNQDRISKILMEIKSEENNPSDG